MRSFEYTIFSQAFETSWADLTPFAHAESVTRAFASLLPTMTIQFDEAGGGGWEAISHHLLRLDDGALLTVMARRPSNPSGNS